MSRKKGVPSLRFHVSGQSRITVDGRDIYFGKHGEPETQARYHAFIAEYIKAGMQMPDDVETHQIDEPIRIRDVVADYRAEELPRFVHDNGQHNRLTNLCHLLETKHGDDPAEEFGPRKLRALRQSFVDAGCSRKYANTKANLIIKILEHGVGQELVSASVITALRALPLLRRGQAKDNPKPTAADLDDVNATLPKLSPVLQAMVRIQLATAMRPSELFAMTPSMIDRSGKVWIYRPTDHKTAHRGKTKAVPIVGDALAALQPYLFGDPDSLCFVTSKGTPWNKDSYRRQITRACKAAGTHWTPYGLRRLAAQRVRDALGVEHAQALLGHSRCDTTELYASVSEARAIEAARALG